MIVNEVELLSGLSSWFRISSVILCKQLTDSDFGQLGQLSDLYGKQMSLHFADADKGALSLPKIMDRQVREETNTMVVCDNPEFEKNIQEYDKRHFDSNIFWLVDGIHCSSAVADILPLSLTSNLITFDNSHNNSIALQETYRVKGGPSQKVIFGTFDSETGLSVPIRHKWSRRANLGGAEVITTFVTWNRLIMLSEEEDGENGSARLTGFLGDILQRLQEKLNFSITVIQPQDLLYGVDRSGPNDTSHGWVGMVGQLSRREADLCAAVLTYTRERAEVIDYTVGVMVDRVSLIVADPDKIGGTSANVNMTVFVDIFTLEAWTVVLVSVLAVAFVFSVVHSHYEETIKLTSGDGKSNSRRNYKSKQCNQRQRSKKENSITQRNTIKNTTRCSDGATSKIKSLLLGLNATLLILLQRPFLSDFESSLNRTCFKILFLTSSLMAVALFALYCGDLTAGMTVGVSKSLLTSFEDALSNGYTVNQGGGGAYEEHFAEAAKGTGMNLLYENHFRIRKLELFMQSELDSGRPTKNCYFGSEYSSVLYKTNKFLFLKNFQDRWDSRIAFGLQKDSELKPVFDYYLIKMRQSGVIEQFFSIWTKGRRPEDASDRIFPGSDAAVALGYENLLFLQCLLAAGVAAAAVIAAAERSFAWARLARRRSKT